MSSRRAGRPPFPTPRKDRNITARQRAEHKRRRGLARHRAETDDSRYGVCRVHHAWPAPCLGLARDRYPRNFTDQQNQRERGNDHRALRWTCESRSSHQQAGDPAKHCPGQRAQRGKEWEAEYQCSGHMIRARPAGRHLRHNSREEVGHRRRSTNECA